MGSAENASFVNSYPLYWDNGSINKCMLICNRQKGLKQADWAPILEVDMIGKIVARRQYRLGTYSEFTQGEYGFVQGRGSSEDDVATYVVMYVATYVVIYVAIYVAIYVVAYVARQTRLIFKTT